ncbi:universal stress protein [Tuwongella immobilis]|uniref:Universal stress protein n=1 Tax=Tuwongella immobilis TaxID=692036 RepID=A0A6C2YJV3_9BACT|nr:universal stress protein [Tuwongella immobilis]VIP01860.1 universal stress protein : Universal stress protein OS=Planctomyces maris DSM 8797 GN=PM8797T_30312 PE=3 SV=1: Usp [Tuwongella immobilis]VTR99668.1 universal stress protein : Universal stress protein OS=Planctomyces maris DSM 8797 GN=PM8797T_30312 PE=3 SV=1: Usp [Tuwongella immobilis]
MVTIAKILAPVDFSDNSRTAFHYAVSLADKYGAELLALHIVQDLTLVLPDAMMPTPMVMPSDETLTEQADALLGQFLASEVLPEGLRYRKLVRLGTPFAEIISAATEEQVDLIVMGAHGRSAIMHMLMGSVAEKVVRKAPCPVLTTRQKSHA